MKKILAVLSAIALLTLSACGEKNSLPNENDNSETAAAEDKIDSFGFIGDELSPKTISTDIPTDELKKNFSEVNIVGFSESTNDNDEKFIVSPDGKFSVTYLEYENGEVSTYKLHDLERNADCYYYASNGLLYCVCVGNANNDNVFYYYDDNAELIGIRTFTHKDEISQVETVYSENGDRIAAIYTDETNIYFLDRDLNEITGEKYDLITSDHILAVG